MVNACGPPMDSSDILPPSPSPSCSAILPSHATLLTINRTRTAGPFDCVIPRSSRVPMLNHRGPSSCRPMQGSASSRPFSLFSFRLTDFLHGSLARPGLSAALLLGPSSSVPIPLSSPLTSASGLASMGQPWVVQTQHDSSAASKALPRFWRLLLTPLPTHEIGCHNPGPSSNKR